MPSLKPLELVAVALSKGRVTRRYPFEPPLVTPEFRGAIEIDPSKCLGCGACARACPPNALELIEAGGRVAVRYFAGRCIFCWRCVEVCPAGAIRGTREFELATDRVEDLYQHVVHSQVECEECGRPFATRRLAAFVAVRAPASEEYASLCPDCRRRMLAEAVARGRGGA